MVEKLEAVPGTGRVSPDLQGTAIIAGKDGKVVRNSGAPGLGFAFSEDDPAFTLVAGRGPTQPGQVAVESATLDKAGLAVGDSTRAVLGGVTTTVTITGEVEFGILFGATAVLLDEATARHLFAPDGTVPSITVTAEQDVTQSTLRDSIADVLPPSAEAVTGADVEADNEAAVQQGLGFFTTFLLVFAGVALFVGAFIIVNTFSMLIGQRARELALLRALGASRGQVLGSVLGEAAIVGVVGSALGIGLGVLIAQGAKAAIRWALGVDIGTSLPVTLSTLLISLAVGTLVTVAAAVVPARRAARTAPVAAMRGETAVAPKGLRLRGTIGASLVALGGGRPRGERHQVERALVDRRHRRGHGCAGTAGGGAVGRPTGRPCHRLALRHAGRRHRQAGPAERPAGAATHGGYRQRPDDRARPGRRHLGARPERQGQRVRRSGERAPLRLRPERRRVPDPRRRGRRGPWPARRRVRVRHQPRTRPDRGLQGRRSSRIRVRRVGQLHRRHVLRDPRRPRRRQRPDRPNHSRPPRLEGGRRPRMPRSAPWPSTSSWSAASTRTARPSPT